MKALYIIVTCLTIVTCLSQEKQFYSEEFNWRMNVPDDFKTVTEQQYAEIGKKGLEALQKTIGTKLENRSTSLLKMSKGPKNYLEANTQSFDELVDGNYESVQKSIHKILYKTFKDQLPNIIMDSTTTMETVSDLKFITYKLIISLPNDIKLNLHMYSRLFGNKDFTLFVMFVDNKIGEQITELWKGSSFQ